VRLTHGIAADRALWSAAIPDTPEAPPHCHFSDRTEDDSGFVTAWAILQVAQAQAQTAKAPTPLGDIDLNAAEIVNGRRSVASALTPIDEIVSTIEQRD
jgi:hypothetical protein